ncbi:hypothetical protein ACN28S_58505 [Cystobacter fuscus]
MTLAALMVSCSVGLSRSMRLVMSPSSVEGMDRGPEVMAHSEKRHSPASVTSRPWSRST